MLKSRAFEIFNSHNSILKKNSPDFNKCKRKVCDQNSVTFVGVLKACVSMVVIEEGRCVHQQIIQSGLESNVIVGSSLVEMYAKCGSIEDAWRVFNKMSSQNVVTWNAILEDVPCRGMVRKLLNILNRCVKKSYNQMISLLFVVCQLVAMQVWWMKAGTVMLQWSQTIWFLQNWNITPVWLTFLAMLAIYGRQRT